MSAAELIVAVTALRCHMAGNPGLTLDQRCALAKALVAEYGLGVTHGRLLELAAPASSSACVGAAPRKPSTFAARTRQPR